MNPFEIDVKILELFRTNDYRKYEIRVTYLNPPKKGHEVFYARKRLHLNSPCTLHSPEMRHRLYRLTWEALMNLFGAVFGDEGSYDLQPWRQVWLAHQHVIRRTLVQKLEEALNNI